MNIEELTEKIRDTLSDCGTSLSENEKNRISVTIREYFATATGVELRTTAEQRSFIWIKASNGILPELHNVMSLCKDIDSLTIALHARDAEIERLKESARRNGEA